MKMDALRRGARLLVGFIALPKRSDFRRQRSASSSQGWIAGGRSTLMNHGSHRAFQAAARERVARVRRCAAHSFKRR